MGKQSTCIFDWERAANIQFGPVSRAAARRRFTALQASRTPCERGSSMFKVLECISGEHDMRLVLLAAFVWILGSAAIFLLLGRSLDCVDARRRQWLAIAALAAGVGVWATHFIAMLAYRGAVPLRFAPGMTATSVVIAILAFWSAFLVLGREFRPAASGMAGLMAAIGVAAMHFAGMAAIDAPVAVQYDWPAIAAAFVLTAMIFVAAFWLFGKLKEKWRILLPASLAVAAVLLLHFTAMSATLLVPDPARGPPAAGTGDGWLVAATVVATIALIGLVLIGAFLDRLLTDRLSPAGRAQRPRSGGSSGPISSHSASDKSPRPMTAPQKQS
ncbi:MULTISPECIES: MHYT domain-containing protein [Sphingopyxis]|nr:MULTISPECIES: MHYT domain-containing protein [Sphingopyxis]